MQFNVSLTNDGKVPAVATLKVKYTPSNNESVVIVDLCPVISYPIH